MATKRYYFETEETHTTKKKGWIEIDMDYTQVYHCFNKIAPKINSATTFKLLHWLLANKMNDSNGIDASTTSFNQFNNYLTAECGANCAITYRTFSRGITELKDAGALTKVGKGHYYANPNMFWTLGKEERVELLKLESKDPNLESINPRVD